ncbi:hypothetical protein PHLGIDRAFT_389624 [Phlebiopsis gigantea 11061_1 CR5-6]|uniref:Uncharacterized protein n=1 Tax=Phlebiopsis gigantea (strain 11061_1 CR5-6) TaxID=745531 RepID=A0A0C3SBQ1_PHLG1|nr:hypothetical protein PHLGIDRAFT_389624 [Phlebiopsis gigantea 11061_1 CR5-6]
MVAPITLDMHSETQRAHASETVHAYCLNSALHLVALIVLPHSSPASRASRLRRRHTQPVKPGLAFPMWNSSELVSSTLEPLIIVGDYFNLLMKSSGRVVVMSRCFPTSKSHILNRMWTY